MKRVRSEGVAGGMPRALFERLVVVLVWNEGWGGLGGAYMRARRTSAMGMTPSFSPWRGSAKREKASRISDSSCAVMLFSLASLEGRAVAGSLEAVAAADAPGAGGRRRGGWRVRFGWVEGAGGLPFCCRVIWVSD